MTARACSLEYCRTAERPRMPPMTMSSGPAISDEIAAADGVLDGRNMGEVVCE
jgi:hypothetical protein